MPYGVKITNALFQKAIENVTIGDTENIIYQDGIFSGTTYSKFKKKKIKNGQY